MLISLRNYSNYSICESNIKIEDLVDFANKNNFNAFGLTDYKLLSGSIEFSIECQKAGIQPIIGIDAYMAFRSMEQKDHGIDNKRFPFTLLCENNVGYKNLMKLVTQSYIKGFYYRPRMDKELLKKHAEGLICLSGPIFGEVGQAILTKNIAKAEKIVAEYQEVFGKENYFLEIMFNNHIDGLTEINRDIAELSKKNGSTFSSEA